MKMIEAVIRPEKVADVCAALNEAGQRGMTISDVEGRDAGQGWTHHVRSASFTDTVRARSRVEVVVRDEDAPRVIGAIRDAAATGGAEDGSIFVHDLADVVRIQAGSVRTAL